MSVTDFELNELYKSINNSTQPSNLINPGYNTSSPGIKTEPASLTPDQGSSQPKSSKKAVSSFISKLYNMVENGKHENLISWNAKGTSFFVYNAVQFSQEVLPDFFKHSNFSSFVRLLNMYNFHKINKSPRGQRGINENEIWEFSHPKFQHGHPELLKEIKRKAMDSELLRREAGDIHASFAMLQMSQADLLQQFHILQNNFSHLLQGFEETKKIQLQQQSIIRQLAEKQGINQIDLMNEDLQSTSDNMNGSATNSSATSPTTIYANPNDLHSGYTNPMSYLQYGSTQTTPIQSQLESTSSKQYNPSYSSPFFESAINTPLPPSPMPGSPLLSLSDLKFDDINTLGLGYQN